MSQAASDLIDWLEPRTGEAILDLGCGTGELATAIAARGARVVGLDASAEMIAVARERAPALEWLVGDGEALTFDGTFDAVFSNAALHWMTHAEAAARGIARALKPGGRLVAEFGGAGCVAIVLRRGRDRASRARRRSGALAALVLPDDRRLRGGARVGRARAAHHDALRAPNPPLGRRAGSPTGCRSSSRRSRPTSREAWPAFVAAVETHCRPRLFDGTDWILDYVRLRLRAVKPASA